MTPENATRAAPETVRDPRNADQLGGEISSTNSAAFTSAQRQVVANALARSPSAETALAAALRRALEKGG